MASREVERMEQGRRYVGEKDKKERMWTEITKDLVTEDAIKHLGYDFEETEFFYYIMSYLKYVRLPLFSYPNSAVPFPPLPSFLILANIWAFANEICVRSTGGCPPSRRSLGRSETRSPRTDP